MALLRVWDLPTRLTHGVLILTIVGVFVSAKMGSNWMAWHVYGGHAVAVLLLFRLVWGVVGGHWSRFDAFLVSPVRVCRYVRHGLPPTVGHNPLGSISVLALLGLLAALVITGWVADDEVAYAGPWVSWVSVEFSIQATYWHSHAGQALILVWIGLHLAAVVYHQCIKHEDLVGPMWSGDKSWDLNRAKAIPTSLDNRPHRLKALVWLGLCVVGVGCLVSFGQASG
jgi:cytochrome b